MNLAIDIGNSSCKIGVYRKGTKEAVASSSIKYSNFIQGIISRYRIEKAIVSTVRREEPGLKEMLQDEGIPVMVLDYKTPMPFQINYESPETLGSDRLAAVAGAYNKFRAYNVLIIDTGTAVTYDLLNSDSIYTGGNISPGLDMRFRSLNEFTGRLPLVTRGDSFGNLGVNTVDAIRSGVQTGLIFEINDYIRTLKKKYRELKVVLTGGDSTFLADKLQEKHILIPDLVVDGLNFILDYNA